MTELRRIDKTALQKWEGRHLAGRYTALYCIRDRQPEAEGEIEDILGILSRRPMSERLDVYRRMDRFVSEALSMSDHQTAQMFRNMREYFYARVID